MPPKLQKPKLCYHAELAGKLPFRHGKLRSLSQGKNAKVTSSCKVKLWRQAGGLLAKLLLVILKGFAPSKSQRKKNFFQRITCEIHTFSQNKVFQNNYFVGNDCVSELKKPLCS